jgi:hypothetical protein
VGSLDDASWFAFAASLTVVGVLATWLLWRRRGPAAGLRALAFTLLPMAAYLTHTLRLIGTIVSEVGSWAVHFVFSPLAWLGVILAGMSAVLFGLSWFLRRNEPEDSAPGSAVTGRGSPGIRAAPSRRPAGAPAIQDDDMDDIAVILKKHGIS